MVDQVHLYKRQFGEINTRFWRLQFNRPAKTSKSTLQEHNVLFLSALDDNANMRWGEIAPLTHLSKEKVHDCPTWIARWWNEEVAFEELPSSVKFGLECLLHPMDGSEIAYRPMLINGLVWMNEIDAMYDEAKNKLASGFDCIKIKVGALNFDSECALLQRLRNEFGFDFILRLDANGAWTLDEAKRKLESLSVFQVHSIEQPIAPGQWEKMSELVKISPIPIALDEELIDIKVPDRFEMLKAIQPHFLIIKPTLHGGFASADHWIQMAQELGIQWWATSALESNIGLANIYQWLLQYETKLPQGLGTGSLYANNWMSPLEVTGQMIQWNVGKEWRAPWI